MSDKEEVVKKVTDSTGGAPKVEKMAKISSDMIRPFNGEGDIVGWVEKVKLVAALTGVTDVAKLLPLYLEGPALSVYLEMAAGEKGKIDSIVGRLKEVYCESTFVAHVKLTRLKWTGEPVDEFATEIRRLAGLAGFVDEVERVTRLTFVNSFPDHISVELQQVPGVDGMAMSELLPRARVLVANVGVASSVAAVAWEPKKKDGNKAGGRSMGNAGFKGKCFGCGGSHMARFCPEKKGSVKCYACGEEGHISPHCPNRSGNEQ